VKSLGATGGFLVYVVENFGRETVLAGVRLNQVSMYLFIALFLVSGGLLAQIGRVGRHFEQRLKAVLKEVDNSGIVATSITDAVNRGSIYKFLTKPWNDVQLKPVVE
jgi:hypothetical protein